MCELIEKLVRELADEEVEEATKKATYRERKSFALYMMECGETIERIVEKTHLTMEQVKELVV